MSILAGEKFELRLLKASEILLHEECEDNRSSKLVERFEKEKVLYNPLIVALISGKLILIDGANRFEALRKLECKSILAQIVDYESPGVQLKSWYHFVSEMNMQEIVQFLEENSIKFGKWNRTDKLSSLSIVGVVSKKGEAICIDFGSDLEAMLEALSRMNRFYESRYSYTRIDSDTDITDISSLSPDDGLLIVYPAFKKEDIVKISGLTQKLTAGISRHLIPNRVLHIKILIDALKKDEHLEKRNYDLEQFIQYKIDTKKVRLYKEPILVFDE